MQELAQLQELNFARQSQAIDCPDLIACVSVIHLNLSNKADKVQSQDANDIMLSYTMLGYIMLGYTIALVLETLEAAAKPRQRPGA